VWEGIKKSYAGVGGIFARYWRAYGGSRALFSSPYLHGSVLLAGAMYPFWLRESWWETALSTLPNVLGFTLAGFTIWLGFGDEKFRALISRAKPDKESPFMGVSAGFAHFVVVQILALMAALWAKAMNFPLPNDFWLHEYIRFLVPPGQYLGFLLFIYALMSALAATLGVLRAASWYDQHKRNGSDAAHAAPKSMDAKQKGNLPN
jgi:hypothetical protein